MGGNAGDTFAAAAGCCSVIVKPRAPGAVRQRRPTKSKQSRLRKLPRLFRSHPERKSAGPGEITYPNLLSALFAKKSEDPDAARHRETFRRLLAEVSHQLFVPLIQKFERDYDRSLRLAALRQRRRWRKADVPRLLDIGVKPAAQKRMSRLLRGESALGRGVVSARVAFAETIRTQGKFWARLWDPATPATERRLLYKQTRWWPYFIEAAYRGEREKVTAVEAEARVAAAARISSAEVHRLCQLIRTERGDAQPRDPPRSAADLKRHLEFGPTIDSEELK